MIVQRIRAIYVKYVASGPRVLKDHPHFKQAYATNNGTNCTRRDNEQYAFVNLQTMGAVCAERGTMCLAQDHLVR